LQDFKSFSRLFPHVIPDDEVAGYVTTSKYLSSLDEKESYSKTKFLYALIDDKKLDHATFEHYQRVNVRCNLPEMKDKRLSFLDYVLFEEEIPHEASFLRGLEELINLTVVINR